MMLRPVAYDVEEQQLIDAFDSMPAKEGSYWNDDALSELKLKIKRHYQEEQGFTCCYCRQVIPISHLRAWDTEHVVPKSSHALFMFTPLNLAAACADCNGKKSANQTLVDVIQTTYPDNGDDFYIIHPHFDRYSDHIERGDFTYVPLTDKGTWTIAKCGLTRFAGKRIGWPEPIPDERFEEEVDQIQAGDATGVTAIVSELRLAITPANTP